MTPFSLAGTKVAIIGATGALGKECSREAAVLGAETWLLGRRPVETGDDAHPSRRVACDLESPQSIVDAVAALPEIHGAVFVAGVLLVRPLRMSGDAELRRVMLVNYEGPVAFCRELLRQRRLTDGASIVFVGSIAGRVGAIGHTLYSGSKGALAAFARSLAVELAPRRIRVNTVSPGLVNAGMGVTGNGAHSKTEAERYEKEYPLGLGQPADVAGTVCFLLSPAARWMTGADLVLDGGVSIR